MSDRQSRTLGTSYVDQAPVPGARLKRRRGQPTKFNDEIVLEACVLAQRGRTDQEIATELGVTVSTLYLWYNTHPNFSDAVKSAKAAFDDRIERTLAQRALGYTQDAEKVFANGFRTTVREHVQPDTTAQIFWLKNRKRLDWSDRREHELIVPGDTTTTNPEDNPRQLALAMLALVSEAAHNPPPTHAGPMIEATPQVEEPETDEQEFDPDFDE